MKIKSMKIQGIARIKSELSLEFNEGMNIICGINGTCKTTILECISHFFASNLGSANEENLLKRNVASELGVCEIKMGQYGTQSKKYNIQHFDPMIKDLAHNQTGENKNLLYFKTRRDFFYKRLNAIPSDPTNTTYEYGAQNVTGQDFKDFKGWFVSRYLYSHIPDALSKEQTANLETVKECFNVLDKSISFSRVVAGSNDVMINTPQGEIYYEYLSSGYKSCLYILLGIIKEIEFRFKAPTISVTDFDGIILIDEIDLHLHPVWQATISKSLKETFPKAQIIMTTHSPHIIQSAEVNEIIPLIIGKDGNILINKMDVNEYGYQGWTVEEILEYVMGMETTRSELYTQTINDFNKALNDEDDSVAVAKYKILQKMLHPRNPLTKILEIQMAGVEKDVD